MRNKDKNEGFDGLEIPEELLKSPPAGPAGACSHNLINLRTLTCAECGTPVDDPRSSCPAYRVEGE